MAIIAKEIFDDEGKLTHIEYTNGYGEHVIDAVWDERDEHTPEKIEAFREWASKMLDDMDIPVVDSTPLLKEV
jgi:hypothetical protein